MATAAERAVMVRAALARLAPRQRAALVLRYFEDLTEAATAEVLGCSVSTVKSQLVCTVPSMEGHVCKVLPA